MKQYLSFYRIRFSAGLQYRAAALGGLATQFAWGSMLILMFSAFYRSSPENFPMTLQQTATYIWLQQALLAMFASWSYDNEIFSSITSGNVAYELCRPMSLYTMWFTKNAATRLARAVLRCIPILVVAVFLPAPYGLMAPPNIAAAVMFAVSCVLAFGVSLAIVMLVYIGTFFTMSPMGLRLIMLSLSEFMSGSIIPLPFLPDRIAQVLELLPFGAISNVPFRVYSGHLAGNDAVFAIAVQVFWLVTLIAFGKLLINRALRRVVVQGG